MSERLFIFSCLLQSKTTNSDSKAKFGLEINETSRLSAFNTLLRANIGNRILAQKQYPKARRAENRKRVLLIMISSGAKGIRIHRISGQKFPLPWSTRFKSHIILQWWRRRRKANTLIGPKVTVAKDNTRPHCRVPAPCDTIHLG